MKREAFKFWDLVRLILETLRYPSRSRFVVFCCGQIIVDFIHILHGHYSDVIMSAMVSDIAGVSIVGSTRTVCSGADQRKHQSSASLVFVRGIHRWPVSRIVLPFDDVIIVFEQPNPNKINSGKVWIPYITRCSIVTLYGVKLGSALAPEPAFENVVYKMSSILFVR